MELASKKGYAGFYKPEFIRRGFKKSHGIQIWIIL